MNTRTEAQPGYMGPKTEAQRDRELIAARLASPKRGRVAAESPADLALFSSHYAPTLF